MPVKELYGGALLLDIPAGYVDVRYIMPWVKKITMFLLE